MRWFFRLIGLLRLSLGPAAISSRRDRHGTCRKHPAIGPHPDVRQAWSGSRGQAAVVGQAWSGRRDTGAAAGRGDGQTWRRGGDGGARWRADFFAAVDIACFSYIVSR
ncbi:hypothetical protein GCM10011574_63310 [Microbispora bryophytorum]|uniref:Uncharacterized protein n=1 Tax=Microbispora bryophytorum TaxID=1460882 RepID=A0A8H9H5Y0_9ACTN|nr:hypothetical protein GCM10011574_63310 [Microbispora bryophytorum]